MWLQWLDGDTMMLEIQRGHWDHAACAKMLQCECNETMLLVPTTTLPHSTQQIRCCPVPWYHCNEGWCHQFGVLPIIDVLRFLKFVTWYFWQSEVMMLEQRDDPPLLNGNVLNQVSQPATCGWRRRLPLLLLYSSTCHIVNVVQLSTEITHF